MTKFAVIADDITGANDTGVQFAKAGLRTFVLMKGGYLGYDAHDIDAVVVDTDSRAVPDKQAYQMVKEVAQWVKEHNFDVVYKKVDSTLRGNVAVEIDAAMDGLGCELAIIAPAMPKNGRKTIGGVHLLNNVPIELTEISRDPKCPVKESHIPYLIGQKSLRQIGHISYKTIVQGSQAIKSELERLYASGHTLITCDVCFDEDLTAIAHAGLKLEKKLLWVGSAGLAEALSQICIDGKKPEKPSLPVVVMAGSVSEVTRKQVHELIVNGVEHISVDARQLLEDDKVVERYLNGIAEQAAALIQLNIDIVITSGETNEQISAAQQAGAERGLTPTEVSNHIAAALGSIGKKLAEFDIAGMVLTGGDTAVSVCRSLGTQGIQVTGEVCFGIPVGEMVAANGKKIKTVTKAGAFGDAAALVNAVKVLKQS